MTTTRHFFVPTNATKVTDKQSDAVAYIYTNAAGRPCARVFYGRQSKPVIGGYFRSTTEREQSVRRYFEIRRAHNARKAADAAARKAAVHTYETGDILDTCWGYEQTNREFFEVVAVKGASVVVREIAQVREATGQDTGICLPQPGTFIGEPLSRRPTTGGVRIDRSRFASRWSTHKVAGVAVGPALSYSTYA